LLWEKGLAGMILEYALPAYLSTGSHNSVNIPGSFKSPDTYFVFQMEEDWIKLTRIVGKLILLFKKKLYMVINLDTHARNFLQYQRMYSKLDARKCGFCNRY
jgi:hypothetical protein